MEICIPSYNKKVQKHSTRNKFGKTFVPKSINNGSFHNKSIHAQDFHPA
jgi:hypothetical protein